MKQIQNILILCAFIPNLFGQKVEIAVQKGHSAEITSISFNSDGRLLASSGADNLIKLWHVATGKEMASFISASLLPVKSISFDKTDDFLYVKYEDGSVHTWDIASSSLKSTENARSGIHFHNQKYYSTADSLYTFVIDRFYLRKKERKTNKNIFSKVPVDISQNFSSIAVSEEYKRAMAACGDGKVYVYDIAKGKNISVLSDHLSSVNSVCLAPGDNIFATASADRSIIIWDTRTLKPLKRLSGKSFRFEALAFDHSGTMLAVGDELGTGRTIDLKSIRVKVSSYAWHDQKISDIKFSADDKFIYSTGFDNRLSIFDVQKEKLQKVKYLNYVSLGDAFQRSLNVYREPFAWLNTVSISPGGQYVATGGGWRESIERRQPQTIIFTNNATGSVKKIKAHQGQIGSIAFTSNLTMLSSFGNSLCQWYYNPSGEKFFFTEKKFSDSTNIISVVPFTRDTIIINADRAVILYDLKAENEIQTMRHGKRVTSICAEGKTGRIAYATFNDLFIGIGSNLSAARVIRAAHTDKITAMAFSPGRPILATASWDATIKLWNTDTGELLATIITIGKEDHIIITPDNFYFGTRNSLKGIGFKYGKQFISPEQYDLRFNRPDIVLARLGYAPANIIKSYHRAYLKRLQKMNFTEQMLGEEIHLPEIRIISKNIPLTTSDTTLQFDVDASDSHYKLDRLNVFVNNIPVYGVGGIDVRDKKQGSLIYLINARLSEGKNKIQVSCLNEKGVESLLETFEINNVRPVRKPDLYLAVISVSQYVNSTMNLKYAAKDGRDIVKLFTSKAALYDRIFVDTLLNSNAVKEGILNLKARLSKSQVDDEVILYVSGHGLLDSNLDFYFGTHDIDFDHPAGRGIKYDDLEGLLDGIPARKKLLMMDACHSGEVDKTRLQVSTDQSLVLAKNQKGIVKTYTYSAETAEEQYQVGIKTSFELMQELFANVSKGSGAVVISAAAGNSYALESDEWKNGVFTYALLSGLKTKSADLNKNGRITVTELKNFVSKEVERLTKGEQKPTSRRENLEFDFIVW